MILFLLSTFISTNLYAGTGASLRTEGFSYQLPSSEGILDLRLTQEERFDKKTQFQSDLQVNHWQGKKSHRTYFYPQKLFVSVKEKSATMYVGTNDIQLSHIDFLSPVQFYQTYDLTQPLRSQPFNPLVIGGKSKHSLGVFEVYYMPVRKPSQLPHEKSPWLPQKVYIDSSNILYLPDEVRYSIGTRRNGNHADINNVLVASTMNLNDVDWRVIYYNGISAFPQMTPKVSGQLVQVSNPRIISVDSDVVLDLYDPRTESWGSSLQWAVGKNILRLENAWNRRYYLAGAREEQENAVQIERMVSFFNHGQGVVQLSYLWNNDETLASPSLFSLRQAINRSVLLGTKLNWKEKHDVTAYYLGSTISSKNYLYGVQYKFSPSGHWNIWAGWQGIHGQGQNLFYTYKDMSHFNLGLEWMF